MNTLEESFMKGNGNALWCIRVQLGAEGNDLSKLNKYCGNSKNCLLHFIKIM